MSLRKKLLKESRLYAILDKDVLSKRPLYEISRKIRNSGVDIVQLRAKASKRRDILKEAQSLKKLFQGTKVLVIVNDYLEIAKIAESDGIHLGQYDASLKTARKILGKDKLIGVSCHNLSQALKAQKEGADYISVGPVFSTPLKPKSDAVGLNLIKKISRKIKVPFFAIGGINENNIREVMNCGVNRVVLCRAVCLAKDVSFACKNFSRILHRL